MSTAERKGRTKKRGKKQKKGVGISVPGQDETSFGGEDHQGGQSLTVGQYDSPHFQAGHYGEVEEQLLGYFKNVESSLDDPQFETAEDQRLFVDNVYSEVEGNELRLATNYSCSLILEKLLKISDPFQLRVFMDKLRGRTVELFAHRFASHVCQTVITLAADVVEQEVNESNENKMDTSDDKKDGELLSMEKLILGMCEDIKPVVGGLISQQFASHVIRVLLFVLAGKRVDETNDVKGQLRSKRSTKYKTENNDTLTKSSSRSSPIRRVPPSFKEMFRTLSTELAITSSETDVRSLSVHRVASPVLQLLLEMQEEDAEGQKAKNILLDRILWGVVSDVTKPTENKDRDSWFETLIRDPVGSHLLEVIFKVAPTPVYNKIYTHYLKKKLEKFSLNPIANFVIQNFLTHARNAEQFEKMVKELSGSFEKLLKNGKFGVIRSLVDASLKLGTAEKDIVNGLAGALHMPTDGSQEFVNCVMRMWTYEDWMGASEEEKKNLRNFHMQGSLLLQSIMKMPAQYNAIATTSFLSQRPEVTYQWCFSPVGSRAYESILTSPTVNDKMKKKIMRNLQGHYADLSKDKFGSHIVEHCWAVADIDMKERIASELLKREYDLSEHYIGKCILWTCKIDQYKRRHDEWVEREKGMERKKDLFKDILGDDIKLSGKRKNKQA
ncbi:armadillo-type protein [Phycomyces nitens]|nr:armadillo-type protein [Phycomyces nitens]